MSLAWTLNYWQLYHSQLAPFCFSSQPVTRYCFTFQLTKQPQFCMVRSLIIHRNVCPNVQNTSETTRQMVSLSSFLIISIISMVDKITDHRKMLSICLFVCLFVFTCTKEETNLHHHHFISIACTLTEHSSQSHLIYLL